MTCVRRAVRRAQQERKRDVLRTFAGWPQSITEVVEATPEDGLFQGDLYMRPAVKTWTAGAATLLGDAAHPTLPAFGQGACMAIEDAAVLSRELTAAGDLADAGRIAQALTRYEGKRLPRTKGMVRKAGTMGSMNAWRSPAAVRFRDALISAIPQRLWLRTYEHESTYQL